MSVSVKWNLPEDISQDSRSGRHTDPLTGEEEDDRGVGQMHDAIQSDDRCPDIAGRWNWVAAQSQIFPADPSVIRRGRSRRARAVTSDRVQVRCQRDRGRASPSNDGPADFSPRTNHPFHLSPPGSADLVGLFFIVSRGARVDFSLTSIGCAYTFNR